MSNFVATDVYALFNKGQGSRAVYTLCKKTSDLVASLRMMKMICWKASAAHPKEGELEITFDGNFFFEDDDRDNDMDGQ